MPPGTGGRRSSSGRPESKLAGGRLINVGALEEEQEVPQEVPQPVVSGHRAGWRFGRAGIRVEIQFHFCFFEITERRIERWDLLLIDLISDFA